MNLTDRASLAVEELLLTRKLYRRLITSPKYDQATEWHQVASDAVMLSCLNAAEPFWWERRVIEVVEAAVPGLPAWTARPELFPVPTGFSLFARPIPIPAYGTDHIAPMAGFAWTGATGEYVTIACLIRDADGLLMLAHAAQLAMGDTLDPQTMSPIEMIEGGEIRPRDDSPSKPRGAHMLRVVGSCLLFVEQRIAVRAAQPLDRAARRRFEKANIQYPALQVIRLRTPEPTRREASTSKDQTTSR